MIEQYYHCTVSRYLGPRIIDETPLMDYNSIQCI